jgi:tetratricopeptide (TPR) repeat protein
MRRQADALASAGDALLAAEKRTEAILQYQRASVLYADLQLKPELGALKLKIGEAFLALGHLEEATFFLRQAHDLLLAWGGPVDVGRCYFALAHCQERKGRGEEARKSLEAAAYMFEKGGESGLAAEARAASVK